MCWFIYGWSITIIKVLMNITSQLSPPGLSCCHGIEQPFDPPSKSALMAYHADLVSNQHFTRKVLDGTELTWFVQDFSTWSADTDNSLITTEKDGWCLLVWFSTWSHLYCAIYIPRDRIYYFYLDCSPQSRQCLWVHLVKTRIFRFLLCKTNSFTITYNTRFWQKKIKIIYSPPQISLFDCTISLWKPSIGVADMCF